MSVRALIFLAGLAVGSGCQHRSPAAASASSSSVEDIDALLGAAYDAVNGGRCGQVASMTDPAVRQIEAMKSDGAVLAVRAPDQIASALLSHITASADDGNGNGQSSAVVVGSAWADIFYLRAFCAVEGKKHEQAIAELEQGLSIMPGDVLLTSELAHAHQMLGHFTLAADLFVEAQADVERLSALESVQQTPGWVVNGQDLRWWHGRCLRGIGYSQIELGQLDEAEQTYLQALAVDPADQKAKQELVYIMQLRLQKQQPKNLGE